MSIALNQRIKLQEKHYLLEAGVLYCGAEWITSLTNIIKAQAGFVNLHHQRDEVDRECVHLTIEFTDLESRQQWLSSSKRAEHLTLLDKYRVRGWQEKLDENWQTVPIRNKPKRILCYGDSNTWGFIPGAIDFETMFMERYPINLRWTGILQAMLGAEYEIIEEGMNGRTTNVDYQDIPGRNGLSFLNVALYSHAPLDLVVLNLALNDLKKEFNREAEDVANGMEQLINVVKSSLYGADMQSAPEVLVVAPAIPSNENYTDLMGDKIFLGATAKTKKIIGLYKDLAAENQCHFLDISPYINYSKIDGLHLDAKEHQTMAELMAKTVDEIFMGK